MPKRLAIFDLDGTLVDSGVVVASILNELRREIGKDERVVEDFVPWLSLGGEDLVANGLGLDKRDVTPYLDDFRARYAKLQTPLDSVYDGVLELLNELHELGIKLCVCTNKPRNLAEKVLADTELGKYFSFMCAGGDLKTKKPDPQNLDVCIQFYGESYENSVLIGDSRVDQITAGALGVDFAYFMGGYNDGVDERLVACSFVNHMEIKYLFN